MSEAEDSLRAAGQRLAADLVGSSSRMEGIRRLIAQVAPSEASVLILGESGTGKELVARGIHRLSARARGPFVPVNCGAIPGELLESELFGHEKGAFTGAQGQRRGRFEQANGGTLFLDEIGDMPADLQTRLLRVLSDGEFYRVGGHEAVKADVRIIAATHQDLNSLVNQGKFREDLMHRLNVIRIHVPALRERREDIPVLLTHFLSRVARELDVEAKQLEPEVINYLSNLDWAGNVRQLENICRWLTVMASGKTIRLEDLPHELRESEQSTDQTESWQSMLANWAEHSLADGRSNILQDALPQFESTLIEVAMRQTGGKRQRAAKLLGWGRNTLTRKIQELDIRGLHKNPIDG